MDQALLRSLGVTERIFAWFTDAGWMTHVVVAQLRVCPSPTQLQQALGWLRDRHRALAVQIVFARGRLHFVSCQAEPVLALSALVPGDDPRWPRQAQQSLHQGFDDPDALLWRTNLVRGPGEGASLVWSFHHAVEDGLSTEVFLHELLVCLCALRAGQPLPALPEPVLHERVEVLTQARLTWSTKLWCVTRALGRAAVRPHVWKEQDAPVDARRTRVLCRVLPQDKTRALVERARAEETTVHGALCAAMLLAARREVGGEARLLCDANVNMRPLCRPPMAPDAVGMFISSVSWMYLVKEDTDFWSLAREVKRRTQACIVRGDPVQHPLLLDWVQATPEAMAEAAEEDAGRNQAVFVSNLGRYPYAGDASALEGLFYATGQHARGASLWLGAVTLGGRLHLSFSYVDPILGADTAWRAVEDVVASLRRLGLRVSG